MDKLNCIGCSPGRQMENERRLNGMKDSMRQLNIYLIAFKKEYRVWGFPDGQVVKNLPAIQETRVQSLGREGPLEEEMATHSSILAWRIPWTEEPGGLWSMESHRHTHQWLRLCTPSAGGPGSIPGQGTRSHMLQLRVCMPQLKIPHATVKIKEPTCHN